MSDISQSLWLRRLATEYLQTTALRPDPRNARTHSRKQIKQLAKSIERFGFNIPIVIDEGGMILAGHGRVAAAKELGLKEVPCVRVEHLTPEEKRAFALADNKIAQNGGWDEELLKDEFEALIKIDVAFDFDGIGFSTAEVDELRRPGNPDEGRDPADDRLPALAKGPPVTRMGDLLLCGPHKLLCGDATKPETFATLMGEERAQMVFTDPPYNVAIVRNVTGLGRIKHPDFGMAAGEMSKEGFTAFLKKACGHLAKFSVDGSIHFICMDWRHQAELLAAGADIYAELKNVCVWVKDNGGMGTFYRSRHELVFVFKAGTAPHINNFELGQHGRYRTNVWEYRGANSRGRARKEALELHPTVKPVALIADAIRDVSHPSGIVLDCFSGSGSTLIAAHKTGRRARLIELDPIYVDRSIRRWEKYAKDDAILADTGETFAEVAERRRLESGEGV